MAFTCAITTNLNSWSFSRTASYTTVIGGTTATQKYSSSGNRHTTAYGSTQTSANGSTGSFKTVNQTGSSTSATTYWTAIGAIPDSVSDSTARNGTYTTQTTVTAQSTKTIQSTITDTIQTTQTDWTAGTSATFTSTSQITTLGGTKTETSTYNTTSSGTGSVLSLTTTAVVFPAHDKVLFSYLTTNTIEGTGQMSDVTQSLSSWLSAVEFYSTVVPNAGYTTTVTHWSTGYETASATLTVTTGSTRTFTGQTTSNGIPTTETFQVDGTTTTATSVASTGITRLSSYVQTFPPFNSVELIEETYRSTVVDTWSYTINTVSKTGIYTGRDSSYVTNELDNVAKTSTTWAFVPFGNYQSYVSWTTYYTYRPTTNVWTQGTTAGDMFLNNREIDRGIVLPATDMGQISDYGMGLSGAPAAWTDALTNLPLSHVSYGLGGSTIIQLPYSSFSATVEDFDMDIAEWVSTTYQASQSLASITVSSLPNTGASSSTSWVWSKMLNSVNTVYTSYSAGANHVYSITQIGSGVYRTTRNGSSTTETGMLVGSFTNNIALGDAVAYDELPVASVLPWREHITGEMSYGPNGKTL